MYQWIFSHNIYDCFRLQKLLKWNVNLVIRIMECIQSIKDEKVLLISSVNFIAYCAWAFGNDYILKILLSCYTSIRTLLIIINSKCLLHLYDKWRNVHELREHGLYLHVSQSNKYFILLAIGNFGKSRGWINLPKGIINLVFLYS